VNTAWLALKAFEQAGTRKKRMKKKKSQKGMSPHLMGTSQSARTTRVVPAPSMAARRHGGAALCLFSHATSSRSFSSTKALSEKVEQAQTNKSHNSTSLTSAGRHLSDNTTLSLVGPERAAAEFMGVGAREEIRRNDPPGLSPTVLWGALYAGDSRLRGKRFNSFWITETGPRNFLN